MLADSLLIDFILSLHDLEALDELLAYGLSEGGREGGDRLIRASSLHGHRYKMHYLTSFSFSNSSDLLPFSCISTWMLPILALSSSLRALRRASSSSVYPNHIPTRRWPLCLSSKRAHFVLITLQPALHSPSFPPPPPPLRNGFPALSSRPQAA